MCLYGIPLGDNLPLKWDYLVQSYAKQHILMIQDCIEDTAKNLAVGFVFVVTPMLTEKDGIMEFRMTKKEYLESDFIPSASTNTDMKSKNKAVEAVSIYDFVTGTQASA